MFDRDLFLKESCKHEEAFSRKFQQDAGFALDGPNDSRLWDSAVPKILFLLKETYGGTGRFFWCMDSFGYNEASNPKGTGFYSNKTNRNIAKLAYGLTEIYHGKKPNKTNGMSRKVLSEYYKRIATIEIKKSTNRKSKYSNNRDILERAGFSASFIRWQIDYLQPDIIVCCSKITEMALKKYNLVGEPAKYQICISQHPSAPRYKVDDILRKFQESIQPERCEEQSYGRTSNDIVNTHH